MEIYSLFACALQNQMAIAYTADFKFLANVQVRTGEEIQCEINKIFNWSEAHRICLYPWRSVLYTLLLVKQPAHLYKVGKHWLKVVVNSFADLEVTQPNSSCRFSIQCRRSINCHQS